LGFYLYSTKCQFIPQNTHDFELDISNMLGSWGDHHPQKGLAKFGYRSEKKVGFFGNPAIIWLLSKYGDFQNKIWQHGTIRKNGPMLPDSALPPPPKKFYGGLSGPFFWLPSDKNSMKKKKLA